MLRALTQTWVLGGCKADISELPLRTNMCRRRCQIVYVQWLPGGRVGAAGAQEDVVAHARLPSHV